MTYLPQLSLDMAHMASVFYSYLSSAYQWNFSNKIQVPYIKAWCKLSVSDKKKPSFTENVILPTEYHFSLQLIFASLVLQYIF